MKFTESPIAKRSYTLKLTFGLLPKQIRFRFVRLTLIQVLVGVLDLASVVLFGALGALVINGVSSRLPGDRVSSFLRVLQLEDMEFRTQAAIIAFLALVISISRTILSMYFTKRTLVLLSNASAEITIGLFSDVIKSNMRHVQSRSSQETLYALSRGVDVMVVQVLGTSASLVADIASLTIITLGLFVVDPLIAFSTLMLFGGMGVILYKFMHARAKALAILKTEYEIKSNTKILEALQLFREIYVHHREENYIDKIAELRRKSASAIAEAMFLPSLSKFTIEIVIVAGAVLIGISQFVLNDAYRAIATLGVFLAAGTRIAPAVLRVQQGFLSIRANKGLIGPTLTLMSSLQETKTGLELMTPTRNRELVTSEFDIEARDLSFKYSNSSDFAIRNLSLNITPGTMTAIVGGSGAGKSTLIDLLLGILIPDAGSIRISGHTPSALIRKSPGYISYVPQNITMIDGSIRENLCLGLREFELSDQDIWEALRKANLDEAVTLMNGQLDAQVGENGNMLSGGQRQRLGLARALVTRPQVIILDEATSALDAVTELNIVEAFNHLRGNVTVVIVAHRLSSVRGADQVVYMEKGLIIATGTFQEVREKVPDFDKQSQLMGL